MSNPNGLIQKVACEVIRDRARAARLCLEHTGTTLGLSAFLPPRWGHFFDRAMGSIASPPSLRFNSAVPQDPFIREKFTRERTAAKKLAAEYFQRFPKEHYRTEVESWRHLQSQNIEFT